MQRSSLTVIAHKRREEPGDEGRIDPYTDSVGKILSLIYIYQYSVDYIVLYLSVPRFGIDISAQFDVHMQPAPTVVLKCLQAVESNG